MQKTDETQPNELAEKLEEINQHPHGHGIVKNGKKSKNTDKGRLFKLALNYSMSHLDKDGKPKDNENTFDLFEFGVINTIHAIIMQFGSDVEFACVQPNEYDVFMKNEKKIPLLNDDGSKKLDASGKVIKGYKYRAGQSKSPHVHVMLKFRSQHRVSAVLNMFKKYDFLKSEEIVVDHDVPHAIAYPQHVDPSAIGKKMTFGDDKVFFYFSKWNPADVEKTPEHYNVLVGYEFLGVNFLNVDSDIDASQSVVSPTSLYTYIHPVMPVYYCNNFHDGDFPDMIDVKDYDNKDVYHFKIYGKSLYAYKEFQKLKRKGSLLVSPANSPFKLSKVVSDSTNFVANLAHDLANDDIPDIDAVKYEIEQEYSKFWDKHSDDIIANTNTADKDSLNKESFIFKILHLKDNQKLMNDAMDDLLAKRAKSQQLGDANRTAIFYGGATAGTGKTQGAKGIAFTHDGRPSFITPSHTKGTVDDYVDGYNQIISKAIIYDDANSSSGGPIDFIKASADNHTTRSTGSRGKAKMLVHDEFIMTTTTTLFYFVRDCIKAGYDTSDKDFDIHNPVVCDIMQQCIRRFGYNCEPHRVKPRLKNGMTIETTQFEFPNLKVKHFDRQANEWVSIGYDYFENYEGHLSSDTDVKPIENKVYDYIYKTGKYFVPDFYDFGSSNFYRYMHDKFPIESGKPLFVAQQTSTMPLGEYKLHQEPTDAVGPDGVCYATYTDLRKIDQGAIVKLGDELKEYERTNSKVPDAWIDELKRLSQGEHQNYVKCHDIRAKRDSLGEELINYGILMNKLMHVDTKLSKYLKRVSSQELDKETQQLIDAKREAESNPDVF